MSWINKVKAILIVAISTIISFFIIEYFYRFTSNDGINNPHRTMLFEAGDNFKNHDGYLKYFPNKEIRSVTLYSKSEPSSIDDLVIEFDYQIRTNNLGLVMQRDVYPNETAIYVIGDSFTEGQGASPWFYELEDSYDVTKPKILNLGILGTGPQQWENLASATSRELGLDVVATVVNIIPYDMLREIWHFKERELNCLYRASCDYVLGFQGYEFLSQESDDDIKQSLLDNLKSDKNSISSSESNFSTLKELLKKSEVIIDLFALFKRSIDEKSDTVAANKASILALRESALGNFYVNVISQKNLDSSNYANDLIAQQLIDFLNENQITYSLCDIPVDGFHKYDGHPNAKGYKIVRECTESSIKALVTDI